VKGTRFQDYWGQTPNCSEMNVKTSMPKGQFLNERIRVRRLSVDGPTHVYQSVAKDFQRGWEVELTNYDYVRVSGFEGEESKR
jgi:hypothetical protein